MVDGYRTERHELDVSSGFRRVTTEIVLVGGGLEGRGEDVTYAAEDHDDYPAALPLAGEWTLDGFSRQLGGLDLFPGRPPSRSSSATIGAGASRAPLSTSPCASRS